MLKWSLGAIIILILMGGVALSILLDQPERFRPQIEALAAEQVGAPIRLGQLSWQWQPNFALSVSEVEINPNDGPIVQVQLVDVDFKASLLALLTEQSLVVLGIEWSVCRCCKGKPLALHRPQRQSAITTLKDSRRHS